MFTRTLLLATALCTVGGTAYAGPCTERISMIEKSLNTTDAGSGPTKKTATTMSAPTAPGMPKAGEAPGTGGTAGMNAAVGQTAASPADVQAQTQGAPTAAQAAQSGKASSSPSTQVSDALRVAKAADQKGDASACTRAVEDAERFLKG